MQNYRGQNFSGGYIRNNRNDNFGRGKSRSRDRQYSDTFIRNDRSSISRARLCLRICTNRDRIRCFGCREYDHFTKDCTNLQTDKQPEQIQQMYNLDMEQTALKASATDMHDNFISTNSDNNIVEYLNL